MPKLKIYTFVNFKVSLNRISFNLRLNLPRMLNAKDVLNIHYTNVLNLAPKTFNSKEKIIL